MKKERWRFLWLCAAWLAILLIILGFSAAGVKMTILSRDPLQQLGQAFYIGLISHLGILAWCVAASVPLFASFHVTRSGGEATAARFLRGFGVLNLILLADDSLMLHDVIVPQHLGLSDLWFYAVYAIYVPVLLGSFRRFILAQTPWTILALAFALFGVSVATDIHLLPFGIDVEDGLKIMGITTFAYYGIITASDLIARAASASEEKA